MTITFRLVVSAIFPNLITEEFYKNEFQNDPEKLFAWYCENCGDIWETLRRRDEVKFERVEMK